MREIVTTKTCHVRYSRRKCEFQTKLRRQKTGFRKVDIKRRDAGCGMRDAGCGMRDAGCGMRDIREKRSGNAGSGIRTPFEILFVKLKVILLCDLL